MATSNGVWERWELTLFELCSHFTTTPPIPCLFWSVWRELLWGAFAGPFVAGMGCIWLKPKYWECFLCASQGWDATNKRQFPSSSILMGIGKLNLWIITFFPFCMHIHWNMGTSNFSCWCCFSCKSDY